MKLSELKNIIREKLCKKGEAYRKKRMAAGEKSSAYLSGRAVKVCKGQIKEKILILKPKNNIKVNLHLMVQHIQN
jgi:hypothetical protein